MAITWKRPTLIERIAYALHAEGSVIARLRAAAVARLPYECEA